MTGCCPSLCFATELVRSCTTGRRPASDQLYARAPTPTPPMSPYVTCDWTQALCVRSLFAPASGHKTETTRSQLALDWTRWSYRGQRPVTHNDHLSNSFQLQLLSPLQMCQHHQVYTTMCMCVSFSQIFLRS
jgi:hypothetical protein